MDELDRRRVYARGYNAGRKGAWPDHRPPKPPDDMVRELFIALQGLRDAVDSEIATFDQDDPFVEKLGQWVDKSDLAFERVGRWLCSQPTAE